MKRSSPSSPSLPGSFFPASKNRQPVTAPVLIPPVSPNETDGSDADSNRSDTLTLVQGDWGKYVEPIDIAGYCLMAGGLIGGLYKVFTA